MKRVTLVLALSLFAIHFVQGQGGEDLLMLKRFEGKPLSRAVKYLQSKQQASFSFSSGSIDEIVVPNLPDTLASVGGFLKITLEGTELSFELIGSTFVIFEAEQIPSSKPAQRKDFDLSGVVRDIDTGEALPFASVGMPGTAIATTANSDGKFSLVKVPNDTMLIAVRYLGYKPLNYRLSAQNSQDFLALNLVKQERVLPSVVITAERDGMLELGERVGQLAFNPADIARLPNLGEVDLFAALRLLPGVSSNAEASSGLRIRGSASDENLILFDGIVLYHVDHFFGFLTAFNSNVVKNVQVSKGGYGAKYGSRASGLVDITGIDGNKKEPALSVETGMLSANIVAELPIVENKASLVFAYRRSFTGLLRTPAYRSMFNNAFNSSIPNVESNNIDVFEGDAVPDFSFNDLNAKFHFNPTEKDAIAISFYQGQDDLKIAFGAEADGVTRISEDATNWGNRGGSFKWSRKWNDRFYTYTNYGISRYRSELNAEVSFFLNEDQLLSRRFFEQGVNLDDNTLRIDNTYELSTTSKLEFGVWHSDYRILLQSQDQDFIFSDSVQAASLGALYLDYEKRLGDLTMKGGLRTSQYSGIDKAYLEPRISLTYQMNEMLGLKAATGRYYQMIRRLNERSLYFSIPETWALAGETDVPVLQSDQYILGALVKYSDWELDLEAYHKVESGIVEFLFPEFGIASGSLDQFAVGGERRIFGFDALLRRTFGKQHVIFGYTWLDARSRYEGVNNGDFFRSLGVSQHELNAVYKIGHNRWDLSGSFVITSGLPYTPVLGTFVVTLENGEQQQFVSLGRVNSSRTSWNHRLDLAATYTIPLKRGALKCGLAIYNAYNNMNVMFIDYFEIPEEGTEFFNLGRREVNGLGFTPSLFLRLRI